MPGKGRPRLVATTSSSTKLFVDDLREVAHLAQQENRQVSDLLRELVHEALRTRRLQTIGRDEGENRIRELHQQAIAVGIQPLTDELTTLRTELMEMRNAAQSNQRTQALLECLKLSRASLSFLPALLQRVTIAENVAKVLMTVGMQRDNLPEAEVQAQLAQQDEIGRAESQQLLRQLLAAHGLMHLLEPRAALPEEPQ